MSTNDSTTPPATPPPSKSKPQPGSSGDSLAGPPPTGDGPDTLTGKKTGVRK